MRSIFTMLLFFISLSCLSQAITYKDLPKPIKMQEDSTFYKRYFKKGDTLYVVKNNFFHRQLYRGDGFKMSYNRYTGGKGSIVGWTIFTSIGTIFTLMFLGY